MNVFRQNLRAAPPASWLQPIPCPSDSWRRSLSPRLPGRIVDRALHRHSEFNLLPTAERHSPHAIGTSYSLGPQLHACEMIEEACRFPGIYSGGREAFGVRAAWVLGQAVAKLKAATRLKPRPIKKHPGLNPDACAILPEWITRRAGSRRRPAGQEPGLLRARALLPGSRPAV